MVSVSSAFMSSRRERIILRILSVSDCAFKAAAFVDVLRAGLTALGKTDLDNTDVARAHSFHCIASVESLSARLHTTHVGLMVSISSPLVFEGSKVISAIPKFPKSEQKKRWPTIPGILCCRYCI